MGLLAITAAPDGCVVGSVWFAYKVFAQEYVSPR